MQSHARTMQNLTMQRRHFQLISDVLRAQLPGALARGEKANGTWRSIVDSFAAELSSTNPNFDRARFLQACGVE